MLVALKRQVKGDGCIIVVEPTPEFYTNEWASFPSDYSENKSAESGAPVRAAFRIHPNHAVTDFLWADRTTIKLLRAQDCVCTRLCGH